MRAQEQRLSVEAEVACAHACRGARLVTAHGRIMLCQDRPGSRMSQNVRCSGLYSLCTVSRHTVHHRVVLHSESAIASACQYADLEILLA